jgi:hypothetical protein
MEPNQGGEAEETARKNSTAEKPGKTSGAATGEADLRETTELITSVPPPVVQQTSAIVPLDNTLPAGTPVPRQRKPWPRGNFTPEEELYRAQVGWQNFSNWLREEAEKSGK